MKQIGLEPPVSKNSTHEVIVKIHPNNTYSVWVDRKAEVWQGDLYADWDFLGEETFAKVERVKPQGYQEVKSNANKLTETNQKEAIDDQTFTQTCQNSESLDDFYS